MILRATWLRALYIVCLLALVVSTFVMANSLLKGFDIHGRDYGREDKIERMAILWVVLSGSAFLVRARISPRPFILWPLLTIAATGLLAFLASLIPSG